MFGRPLATRSKRSAALSVCASACAVSVCASVCAPSVCASVCAPSVCASVCALCVCLCVTLCVRSLCVPALSVCASALCVCQAAPCGTHGRCHHHCRAHVHACTQAHAHGAHAMSTAIHASAGHCLTQNLQAAKKKNLPQQPPPFAHHGMLLKHKSFTHYPGAHTCTHEAAPQIPQPSQNSSACVFTQKTHSGAPTHAPVLQPPLSQLSPESHASAEGSMGMGS